MMRKVLLVDDEPFITKGLSVLIDWNSEGYEIAGTASNGLEAIDFLRANPVDVIFADIKMPEMDGMELLKTVREQKLSDASFVIVSGFFEFKFAKYAIHYQCADYILKPVQKSELLELLRKLKREQEERSAKWTASMSKTQSDYPVNGPVTEELAQGTDAGAVSGDSEGEQNPGSAAYGIMADIEQEILEHYHEDISLKSLSEKYYMNSAYLGQLFRKQFGESFKNYLNRIRIEQSVRLLEETNDRIYEIAQAVGYHDLDYYIDKFVTMKGCTPSKYRKQVRG
ncbi:MAG: response regulator [Lachnospiraceae bacterium]|nr:response regulator [Lachnospiraceae bacterium]